MRHVSLERRVREKPPKDTKSAKNGVMNAPQMYPSPNEAQPRAIPRTPVPRTKMPMIAMMNSDTKHQNATASDLKSTFQVFVLNLAKHSQPTNAVTIKAVIQPELLNGGDSNHKSYNHESKKRLDIQP